MKFLVALTLGLLAVTWSGSGRAQPIELGDAIDLGASLTSPPPERGLEPEYIEEGRDDFAIAAGASSILVVWVEAGREVVAAIIDPTTSSVTRPGLLPRCLR